VLPRLVATRKVDVLIMGAVSRSLLERPVIGSTAERIIDHVDCDVFIVKPAGFRTPVERGRRKL
jgi:universal stress protein E